MYVLVWISRILITWTLLLCALLLWRFVVSYLLVSSESGELVSYGMVSAAIVVFVLVIMRAQKREKEMTGRLGQQLSGYRLEFLRRVERNRLISKYADHIYFLARMGVLLLIPPMIYYQSRLPGDLSTEMLVVFICLAIVGIFYIPLAPIFLPRAVRAYINATNEDQRRPPRYDVIVHSLSTVYFMAALAVATYILVAVQL